MVKEKKIRKVFEEIYQEQLAKHRRGGTIQNLCVSMCGVWMWGTP